MNLYLWFITSSDFGAELPSIMFLALTMMHSCETALIRYTDASSSVASWFMRCLLILFGGALTAFVFGGMSLLSAGITVGLSSLMIMTLFTDRILEFFGWNLSLLPAGTPIALAIPVVALEILSFFLRMGTLAIRLLANILVGGIIVHLIFGNAGLIYVAVLGLFYAYEMAVLFFQLYLFGGLSLLYLSESPTVSDFCIS